MRLGGLGGLGLEAGDERLDVAALVVLLLLELEVEALLLAPGLLELVVAAGVEGELALREMQDGRDGAVQQLAVVADDEDGVGVVAQIVLEPQRAFEVEIVGGLVEQQQVGLGEQHGGERHAHAPAAGVFRAGPLLGRLVEAETGQDACGPRRGGMGADVAEALVDVGDAAGIVRRFRLGEQARAFAVGGEHELDQALRSARRFLRHPADAGGAGNIDAAVVGLQLARDQAQQRGLARAVAPDEADLVPRRDARRGLVEDDAPLDAEGEVVDVQHGRKAIAEWGRDVMGWGCGMIGGLCRQ